MKQQTIQSLIETLQNSPNSIERTSVSRQLHVLAKRGALTPEEIRAAIEAHIRAIGQNPASHENSCLKSELVGLCHLYPESYKLILKTLQEEKENESFECQQRREWLAFVLWDIVPLDGGKELVDIYLANPHNATTGIFVITPLIREMAKYDESINEYIREILGDENRVQTLPSLHRVGLESVLNK